MTGATSRSLHITMLVKFAHTLGAHRSGILAGTTTRSRQDRSKAPQQIPYDATAGLRISRPRVFKLKILAIHESKYA